MNNKQNEKWGFILNPTAGNYFGEKYLSTVEKAIKQRNLDGEIALTQFKHHATEIAENFYSAGYRNIVAVGGDGTINEIATFLSTKDDVVMGIIPAGTGNDTVQNMGFPNRFRDEDWDALFAKNVIRMDLGVCNGNIFLNGMGIGFDAQVAAQNYDENGEVKKSGGDKYLWHILKTLFSYKENHFTFLNEHIDKSNLYFMTTYSNGRRFAGKYFITPEAVANDGLLDVCLVGKINVFQRLKLFMQVPDGKHMSDKKNVSYFKTKHISIEFDNKIAYHLDGELHFDNQFEIEIIPGQLQVIYKKNGNHFFNV